MSSCHKISTCLPIWKDKHLHILQTESVFSQFLYRKEFFLMMERSPLILRKSPLFIFVSGPKLGLNVDCDVFHVLCELKFKERDKDRNHDVLSSRFVCCFVSVLKCPLLVLVNAKPFLCWEADAQTPNVSSPLKFSIQDRVAFNASNLRNHLLFHKLPT